MMNKKKILIYIVMFIILVTTFTIGIFDNPNFDFQDFCASLAAEFLGMTFALTVVELFIKEKTKASEKDKTATNE